MSLDDFSHYFHATQRLSAKNQELRAELGHRDDVIYTVGRALGQGSVSRAQEIIAKYEAGLYPEREVSA